MLYRINKKYRIGKKLGSGAFGEIYEGTDIYTNETVAIKIERLGAEHPQLRHEYKVYRLLNGCDGVPMARYYGTEGPYNVLVMDILGKSLEALFEECGRKFSLPTVLMIAEQLISRIETIHKKSLIHRDIKPDNFLIGRGAQNKTVFAVDFGLSKLYMDPKSNRHISYKEGKNLIGTVRYASLYTHMGIEQSRRDDLESIGYVLMYFLRGSLPWQGLQAATKAQKYERVFLKKKSTTIEALCQGFPPEFSKYFKYVKSLKFCDHPNYEYMRQLFTGLLRVMMKDSRLRYDWELREMSSSRAPQPMASSQQKRALPSPDPRFVDEFDVVDTPGAGVGENMEDPQAQEIRLLTSAKKRRTREEGDAVKRPKKEGVVNGLNFDPALIANPTPRQVKNNCTWNAWTDDHICHPIRSNPDPKYHRSSQVQRACVFCHMFTSYYCTKCPPSSIALPFVCMKPKCYVEHVLTYRRWNSVWVPEGNIIRVEDGSVLMDATGSLTHPLLHSDVHAIPLPAYSGPIAPPSKPAITQQQQEQQQPAVFPPSPPNLANDDLY